MISFRTALVTTFALAALATCPTSARAQSDDDEQAARDRRYIERMRAAQATTGADDRADDGATRDDVVAAFVARADELIRDKNYRSGSTDAYVVKTDDPRLDARGAAALLTEFRTWFETFWDGRLPLAPYDERARMYLFWSYYKYNQLFTGKARFDDFRTTGHYRGYLDTVVVHTDGTPPSDLAAVLVHEAAHQLIGQRITGPGRNGPPWLEEGLAEYFAYTRQAADGGFDAGEIGSKQVWPFLEGKPGRSRLADARRDAARRRMKTETGWTVASLLGADPRTFYSGDVEANYGAAWILVHYLFHGEDGRHAERFAGWIAGLRDGTSTSLPDALGVEPSALHDGFAAHAGRMKIR